MGPESFELLRVFAPTIFVHFVLGAVYCLGSILPITRTWARF